MYPFDWGVLKIAVVVLNLWVMLFVLLSIVSKLFVLFVDGLKVVCLVDPWCQRARDGRRRLREAGPVSWLTRLLRRGGSWFDPASFQSSKEK